MAARIILLDGLNLSGLMVRCNIGVRDQQTYVIKRVDEDFFDESGSSKRGDRGTAAQHICSSVTIFCVPAGSRALAVEPVTRSMNGPAPWIGLAVLPHSRAILGRALAKYLAGDNACCLAGDRRGACWMPAAFGRESQWLIPARLVRPGS